MSTADINDLDLSLAAVYAGIEQCDFFGRLLLNFGLNSYQFTTILIDLGFLQLFQCLFVVNPFLSFNDLIQFIHLLNVTNFFVILFWLISRSLLLRFNLNIVVDAVNSNFHFIHQRCFIEAQLN